MPKVGKKHFAYTKAGKKAAKAYAKRMGKKAGPTPLADPTMKWRDREEGKAKPPVKTEPNKTKPIPGRPWKDKGLATPLSDARKRSKKKY
jgi:hypothetical protein